MVKFKIIDGRTKVAKRIKQLQEQLDQVQPTYLKELVTEVVKLSPVDTGTYMDNHNVGVVDKSENSHGKPQGQARGPFEETAIQRMYGQIDALPDNTNTFVANNTPYAHRVEYVYGYAPYTVARAKAPEILRKVIRELGLD